MISTYSNYLEKRALRPAFFPSEPTHSLGMVIVIPSYREEEIFPTLESLLACSKIDKAVIVLIVLNDRATDSTEVVDFHTNQLRELKDWSEQNSSPQLRFFPFYVSQLPKKKAGVGLARKLGMDEAVRLFLKAERAGLIVTLDADTLVSFNYLQAIDAYFEQHPKCPGASIAYQHRIEGLEAQERRGIVQYELHLRLFLGMKRWTGFPYAFETIGSAMVVRAEEYCKQGGMNTRKAGEDFYFLNKFIPLGHFGEINDTCVFPSARISERVPFGTGRAMQTILTSKEEWLTYPPKLFYPLKKLFSNIDEFASSAVLIIEDENLKSYLEQENFVEILAEIKKNTSTIDAFRKRFFRWFDAFRMMKYLHFCLENGEEKVSVLEAGNWYLQKIAMGTEYEEFGEEELLKILRQKG